MNVKITPKKKSKNEIIFRTGNEEKLYQVIKQSDDLSVEQQ